VHIGHYISGAAHAGLIGWLLIGPIFSSAPLPPPVTDVSLISSEEFAALTAPPAGPETETEIAAPTPPAEAQDTPVAPPPDETPEAPSPAPAPEQATEPDTPPAPPAPPAPPEAEVTDTPPQIAPPPVEDLAALPQVTPRPQERPAPRVAPDPVAPPPPDARIDDEVQTAPAPSEAADAPVEEAPETTAPEEAGTILESEANRTEDDTPAAPTASLRPRPRPSRPAPAETDTAATSPATEPDQAPSTQDSVEAALAEALGGGGGGGTAAGGALEDSEIAGVIRAVSREWSVDVGGISANVTVVVRIRLSPEGTLEASPELLSHDGSSEDAGQAAFRRARIAIIAASRNGGFDLPPEKYDDWREIEMTFNPERMRLR